MYNRYLPYISLLLALCLVVKPVGLHAAGLSDLPHHHVSPAVFSVSAGVLAFELFRCRLLDVVAVARAEMVETVRSPVVVADARDAIVDLNPAAQRVLDLIPSVRSQTGRGRRHQADGLPPTRSH